MHYFLLGPSGVGKTHFGNWLEAKRGYHHIRVDDGDQGSQLQREEPTLWALWQRGHHRAYEASPTFVEVAAPFRDGLRKCAETKGKKGCVLTFWSYTVFPPNDIDALVKHDITVKYLYGPKEECIAAAFSRDAAKWSHDKGQARAHWCQYNPTYQRIGGPGLAEYRVDIFEPSGERLSEVEIAGLMSIA
jgi:hypothetical protein